MKNITLILIIILAFAGCKQSGKSTSTIETKQEIIENDIINIYYFHGKQRCKTCIAVGNIAKETIETEFAENEKVRFTELNTSEKANDELVEKYQVTWNALIITKGDDAIDITEEAFANANENPEELKKLIIEEVDKRL